MAQFFTDFSEYTVGQAPSDWTLELSDQGSWTIGSGAAGNYITNTAGVTSTKAALWDKIPDTANVEIYGEFSSPTGTAIQEMNLVARYDSSESLAAAVGGLLNATNRQRVLHIPGYGYWQYNVEAHGHTATGETDLICVRIQHLGTAFRMKSWMKGSAEPSWPTYYTQSYVSDPGKTGLFCNTATTMRCWAFGVGTGGDQAPAAADQIGEKFFTNFSEYLTGQAPSDWTPRATGTADWTIGDYNGNKYLTNTSTTAGHKAITWDAFTGALDTQVYMEVSSPTGNPIEELKALARVTLSGNNPSNALIAGPINATNCELQLYYGGTVYAYGSPVAHNIVANTIDDIICIRLHGVGNSFYLKWWLKAAAEPTRWNLLYTQTYATAAGLAGLYVNTVSTMRCWAFGVATKGALAPTEPLPVTGIPVNKNFDLSTAIKISKSSDYDVKLGITNTLSEVIDLRTAIKRSVAINFDTRTELLLDSNPSVAILKNFDLATTITNNLTEEFDTRVAASRALAKEFDSQVEATMLIAITSISETVQNNPASITGDYLGASGILEYFDTVWIEQAIESWSVTEITFVPTHAPGEYVWRITSEGQTSSTPTTILWSAWITESFATDSGSVPIAPFVVIETEAWLNKAIQTRFNLLPGEYFLKVVNKDLEESEPMLFSILDKQVKLFTTKAKVGLSKSNKFITKANISKQAVTLLAPANLIELNPPATLEWEAAPDAVEYIVQFSETPDFSIVAHFFKTLNTTITIAEFTGTYYWRVGFRED